MRIMRGGSTAASSLAITASARRSEASSVSWVVMTTGTPASGLRPRWSTCYIDTFSSRIAAATSAMTPGRSSTVRRT
jgi:hypothetical protein